MPKLYIIGEAFQTFPEDNYGGDGDIAVKDSTGEMQIKVDGAWVNQLSNLTGTVTPVGAVTPSAVGQYYHDTANDEYFISTGTTSADWEQIVGFSNLSGAGTPVGSVTPDAVDQYYHDTTDDTYFVSTGLTSADWEEIGGSSVKVYRATLTQNGTDVPVANILENTLGGVPVWTRSNPGTYLLTLAGAFPIAKTIFFGFADQEMGNTNLFIGGAVDGDSIYWASQSYDNAKNDFGNGATYGCEILVYP